MNRSAGVTVIAVLAIVGSAIALAIAALSLIGPLTGRALAPPENSWALQHFSGPCCSESANNPFRTQCHMAFWRSS